MAGYNVGAFPAFNLLRFTDEAAGNSKVYTFTGHSGVLLWGYVDNTSTATVGNRQITLELLDGSNVVMGQWPAGAVQAASLTRQYTFSPGAQYMAAFVGTHITTPLPANLVVPAGYKIRLRDSAGIAAGDTLKAYLYFHDLISQP